MIGNRTGPSSNGAQGVCAQSVSGLRLVAFRLRNIIGTMVLLLVPIWFALSFPAGATTPPVRDRGLMQRIESDLSREKRAYETFESKEKRLIEEFSNLEKAAKDIEQEIEKLNHQVDLAELDINGLDEKLTGLETLLKKTQDRVVSRMVALYKHARKGYVKGLFDAEDLRDLRQRAKYASAVIQEDQEELAVWTSIGQKCRSDIMTTKGRLQETTAEREASKALRTRLRAELDGTVVRLMNVHREKEFYEIGVKELELAAKGMSQALTSLTQRDDGYRGDSNRRFADSKGHLPLPMDGRMVTGPNGKGTGSESAFQRGVFFDSAANREVKAVFTGRVDFSGKLKGYGETIIVNHGDRFFTIYAFLANRIKHMGESVNQGEVIGRVGTAGDQFDKRLYFEIRESDKALAPTGWFERQ
jgi:murein hydrolase activator